MSHIPRIAITPGEPAGIGPDLVLFAAHNRYNAELVVIADREILHQRAHLLRIDVQTETFHADRQAQLHTPGRLCVLQVDSKDPAVCATPNPENSRYVLETLRIAVAGCLEHEFAAMVTGPIHKGVLNDAGCPFTGHTEFLGEMTSGTPVMMLVADELRVALLTTHVPLAAVSQAVTAQRITEVIEIVNHDLQRRFSVTQPRIFVCGLNPHAGESGYFGTEEQEIIIPTLDKLRQQGIKLVGPLPADTVFTPQVLKQSDVVVAMYHDQGLPVLKHVGFGRAVNVTLGLPLVRTSVDHGTALEKAGSGDITTGSFNEAVRLAIDLCKNSVQNN